MRSPLHILWRKLFRGRQKKSSRTRAYCFDLPLQQAVQELAARDGRPDEDVASELLASGLAQRLRADSYMELWSSLSLREKQVAALLCQDYPSPNPAAQETGVGYSYRQIAITLKISPQTVKFHVHGALKKLGLRSKRELIQALGNWDFSEWKQDQNTEYRIQKTEDND